MCSLVYKRENVCASIIFLAEQSDIVPINLDPSTVCATHYFPLSAIDLVLTIVDMVVWFGLFRPIIS